MKNILFISSYPFPLNKGSNQHAYFFLKALALNFNVYCVFFVQPESESSLKNNQEELFCLGIKKYDICYFTKYIHTKNKYYNRIERILNFPYSYMNRATNDDGLETINGIINNYSIDIIHFESLHYAKYAFHLPPNLKKTIVYHDLYHLVAWRSIRFEKSYANKLESLVLCFKTYLFQKLIEGKIDKNIFLNPIELLSWTKKSEHIPHIVNKEIICKYPQDTKHFNIIFIGGYNHPPNRKTAKYIINSILPILAKRTKKFNMYFIGSGTEKLKPHISQSQHKKLINVKGFIEDINLVFKDADISFLPILYGGGIKTKIIESMAAGVPVVTTPEGINGLVKLPENCIGVAQGGSALCDELIALMESYELRVERSKIGEKYVKEGHSFINLVNKTKKVYNCL